MATDNSTTIPTAPATAGFVPNRHDVLYGLFNVKGAIRLSREAVYEEMGVNENLVSAEGVLVLAETELKRIIAMIDSAAGAKAWPDSIEDEDVSNGA
jgi:hypothetical protein